MLRNTSSICDGSGHSVDSNVVDVLHSKDKTTRNVMKYDAESIVVYNEVDSAIFGVNVVV